MTKYFIFRDAYMPEEFVIQTLVRIKSVKFAKGKVYIEIKNSYNISKKE